MRLACRPLCSIPCIPVRVPPAFRTIADILPTHDCTLVLASLGLSIHTAGLPVLTGLQLAVQAVIRAVQACHSACATPAPPNHLSQLLTPGSYLHHGPSRPSQQSLARV